MGDQLYVVMQHDYKGFSPGVTMETVTEEDWRGAPALQETPVTSAICDPANGAHLEEGTEEVPGRCCLFSCLSACRTVLRSLLSCCSMSGKLKTSCCRWLLLYTGYLQEALISPNSKFVQQ